MKFANFTGGVSLLGLLFITAGLQAQTRNISDAELKQNTQPLVNSLSYIGRLEPVSFEYKKDEANKLKLPSGQQYGFIAEDVQKVLPGIVKSQKKMIPAGKNAFRTTELKDIEINSLVAFLVASIKEQQAEIDKLKADIQSLKSISTK